jgi:threonine/homoserine/homoserine lactone efflux protein
MFGGALGDLLPLALVIALSPIPIVACILMLFSPRGRANGPAFLLGWVVGITVVTVAVRLVTGAAGGSDDPGDGPDLAALIQLGLGALVLGLAVRQWRARPEPGAAVELPGWMAGIDAFSPGRALGLGVLLSAVNPKNLTMAVAAGVSMSEAIAAGGDPLALEILFVVLASSSVGALVVYDLLGGDGARRRMEGWRTWLIANNAAVMAALLAVIGLKLLGGGLDGLLG